MNVNHYDELNDDLKEEYDFSQMSGGVRGKYAKQYGQQTKLIMLDDDVAKFFPDAYSVNQALRTLSILIQQHGNAQNNVVTLQN